jgi:hypothetical protein
MEIESIVAEGDIVAARTVPRERLGAIAGAPPPTGQSFAARQKSLVPNRGGPARRALGDRDDLSAMLHLGVLQPAGAPPNSLQPSASPPYAGELVTSVGAG